MKSPNHDKSPGKIPEITRRDFVGKALIGSGAALLTAKAPGALAATGGAKPDTFQLGRSVPLPLTGLDQSWTGYGGIGDYRTANGNTHKEVNAAHTLRNGDFADMLKNAEDTGEHYDLVVVGGGFSGCTAAYTFLKEKPDSNVLIFDNHDMFGGISRQNEFEVDGYQLWGPQGATGVEWPQEEAKKINAYSHMWDELDLPKEFKWQEPKGTQLKIPMDTYASMHVTWEAADLGWHHDGHKMAVNPWSNRFADVPLDEKTKRDLIWMEVYRQPPERKDWDRWLDSMTYKEFLHTQMGIDNPKVLEYINPVGAAMGCGLGGDVISAYQAFNFILPGVGQYTRQLGLGDVSDRIWLASFPGGNSGLLRHLVQKLIPGIFGKTQGISDVLTNPIDRNQLDNSGNNVRMRLSSLVVNVQHDGPVERAKKVNLTYLRDGKLYRVTADRVVMGGQQHLNKRVVTDLPKRHRQAMDQFMHAPMMVINVAVRNWRFLDKLGVASVRWFGDDLGWFTTLRRQMILDGKEPMPLHPDKPTVLTMYNSFCIPGLPVEQQATAARMKMFSMSYGEIERKIREQFTKMFSPGGFDADRDIAAITVNRQGHAFVVAPPGFFFGKNGQPAPRDIVREPFGRIAFAHAELEGYQTWVGAAQEGERAAKQVAAIN